MLLHATLKHPPTAPNVEIEPIGEKLSCRPLQICSFITQNFFSNGEGFKSTIPLQSEVEKTRILQLATSHCAMCQLGQWFIFTEEMLHSPIATMVTILNVFQFALNMLT